MIFTITSLNQFYIVTIFEILNPRSLKSLRFRLHIFIIIMKNWEKFFFSTESFQSFI